MKIIFFIGTLGSGGKERRLIDLLVYLKKYTKHEMIVVLRRDQIHYEKFLELDIPLELLTKKYKKKDITLPFRFYNICKEFQPDIIHSWGRMPAFVSLLAAIFQDISHINSQITSAPPKINKWSFSNLIDQINFKYSDVIISNSKAGLRVYNPPTKKSKVIYNGISFNRFDGLMPINKTKSEFNIKTDYAVIMVASFTDRKNYSMFIEVAKLVTQKRKDISFVCVGDGINLNKLKDFCRNNPLIIFTGRINNVETLVHACDIGVLLSNKKIHGEGISNAITEYMAVGKPVIANDAGGTKEIVKNGLNGYLIRHEKPEEIAKKILEFIDHPHKRKIMGQKGRELIEEQFSIDRMATSFVNVYKSVFERRNN